MFIPLGACGGHGGGTRPNRPTPGEAPPDLIKSRPLQRLAYLSEQKI
jgi:hypothetical protein